MAKPGTFQKGHKIQAEATKRKQQKLAKLKDYIAKEAELDPNHPIVDILAAMMTSKDYKERAKGLELFSKHFKKPTTGEPGAIDPEVLAVLAEFDNKRRGKIEQKPGN